MARHVSFQDFALGGIAWQCFEVHGGAYEWHSEHHGVVGRTEGAGTYWLRVSGHTYGPYNTQLAAFMAALTHNATRAA